MSQDNKDDKMIILDKELSAYLFAAVVRFDTSDEVKISATGRHICKLDRIVRLITKMTEVPIVEVQRTSEPTSSEEVKATVVVLRRKPNANEG